MLRDLRALEKLLCLHQQKKSPSSTFFSSNIIIREENVQKNLNFPQRRIFPFLLRIVHIFSEKLSRDSIKYDNINQKRHNMKKILFLKRKVTENSSKKQTFPRSPKENVQMKCKWAVCFMLMKTFFLCWIIASRVDCVDKLRKVSKTWKLNFWFKGRKREESD